MLANDRQRVLGGHPAPHTERDQHGAVGRPPREVRRQLERRGVGPLQVVEHEDHRLAGSEALDEIAHGAMDPEPLAGVDGDVDGRTEPLQRREHRRQRAEPIGPQPVDIRRCERAEVAVDRVDQDRERDVGLELRGPSRQGQTVGGASLVGESLEQP